MTRQEARPAQKWDQPEGETEPEGRPRSWGGLGKGYKRKILEDPETLYKLETQDLEDTKET